MKPFPSRILFIIIVLVSLAGCAVDQDFRSPDMAIHSQYTAAFLPLQTVNSPSENGAVQSFTFAGDLPSLFESFRDPIIVLVSVPMSISGVLIFISLGIGEASLKIYTEVVLVTIIGLISKHGILIV